MAVFNMIEEADATGKVKEVFEDIKIFFYYRFIIIL